MNENEDKVMMSVDEQKAMLKASYEMYERTKADTKKKRKEMTDKNGNPIYSEKSTKDTLKLIETMEADIIEQYVQLGGSVEELQSSKKEARKKRRDDIEKYMSAFNAQEEMKKYLDKQQVENKDNVKEDYQYSTYKEVEQPSMPEYKVPNDDFGAITMVDAVTTESAIEEKVQMPSYTYNPNSKIQFDNIPLPSKGECYKHKMGKVPVAYLTAYDENLIVSPNLYSDGSFIDVLLQSKIMNNNINPDDLLPGDRDAIVLWLRASGYGPNFPVQVTDPETKEVFETMIDLTKIKYIPFKLKGDANGHFSFTLPFSKDVVKFRFLSYGDIKRLNKKEEEENVGVRKEKLSTIVFDLKSYLDRDDDLDTLEKKRLLDSVKKIEEYKDNLPDDTESRYTHAVTNRLIESIVEINNVTDRKYIAEYVAYMSVQDSSALRKYIADNEPGLDFNMEVERPESLGGGSMPMFLSLDQYLFLNIAQ